MIRLIAKISTVVFGNEQDNSYLLKNSVQLFVLHCLSVCIGLLSNYILLKTTSVSNYGSYIYIFNLFYLLVNFCMLGTDTLLVKKISVYDSGGKYHQLKGVLIFALSVCIPASLIITIVSKQLFNLAGLTINTNGIDWFILAFPSLIMLSINILNQSALQGLQKIFLSQVAEKIIRPALLVSFVIILFYSQHKISLSDLIWTNVITIGIAMITTSIFHQQAIAFKIKNIKANYDLGDWTNTALAFFLLSILSILNARVDIFLLGLFKSSNEVGVYNIVLRITDLLGFMLIIINAALAPVIARLFANGEIVKLQKIITNSAWLVLLVSLPLLIIIISFRKNILTFFGVDFLGGQESLLILCAGQLINILCGSVGLLLMMTGNQRFSIYSLIISTIFNIIFNIMLTPKYGLIGTAIATAGSLITWNCLMYLFVRKKINIRPTAFGIV